MKIAFISTILNFPWGGADTLWTHAAESAAGRGDALLIAVSPLTAENPRLQALRCGGARWLTRPAPPPAPSWGQRLGRRIRAELHRPDPLVRALGEFRPDLVVISCGGTGDLVLEPALVAWLRAERIPFRVICNFQQENPTLPESDRLALRAIFASAQALFFVSSRNLAVTRRWLLEALPQASVIQNPLADSPEGQPLPWPAEATVRLATVGRLAPEKGNALLLHAVAAALDPAANWSLDLFGDGPECATLAATIATIGLGDRVALRGRADLNRIWADHHLLISAAIDEGVPMTIPEAMLRGRPVLATCVGGAEDWITPGQDGFLCPAPTLPLLTGAIRDAWSARVQWRTLGATAATSARRRYRAEDYLQLITVRPTAPHLD
jgi:glycosyltransferase involved in cell wall biosynthesis